VSVTRSASNGAPTSQIHGDVSTGRGIASMGDVESLIKLINFTPKSVSTSVKDI
jgi:hypothetical protein